MKRRSLYPNILSGVLFLGLFLPGMSLGQVLGGQFVVGTPSGGFVDVMFQLQSQVNPTFNLGLSTFQFSYNTLALAFPASPTEDVNYTFAAFASDNYSSNVTAPTPGRVSVNVFIFGLTGTPVNNAAMMDVVSFRFQVVDGSQSTGLTWDLCEYSSDDLAIIESSCALFANQDVPLPVELTQFSAQPSENAVALSWETASEADNAGFEVQMQGADTPDWQMVQFIPGAGTTSEPQNYRHTVADLAPGTYRFRLKQIDFDGTFEYSEVVEARLELVGQYQLSQAYPNPFTNQADFTLTLAEAQPVRIDLYDATGRRIWVVHDGWLRGQVTHRFSVNADGLPSGIYMYRVVGDGLHGHRSITVVR